MSRMFAGMLEAIDRGAFPRSRKWAWRSMYNMLSRFWRDGDWRFMNYGFVPPGAPFALNPEDEPDRAFIGLYAQAVDGLKVSGARVLEVGSGRGGGARYIARYHAPSAMVGLDYSSETVRLARRLNGDVPALTFQTGDAEKLPFPDGSFDIVVNIESSHCYANVPAFAQEVSRVLTPGGIFTFADMRARGNIPELDRQLAAPGLDLMEANDITPGVVTALDAAEARKIARIRKAFFMRSFISEFAGAKGSTLYRSLSAGSVAYVARRYRKAD
ncbi:class I SAM-dependent methyltransferase [Xanthobacteraceae bacterium A53D]